MEQRVRRIEIGEIRKDARGWVLDLAKAAGLPLPFLAGGHAASVEPGAVRGNHYHEDAEEWLLIFGGPVRVLWQSPGEKDSKEEVVLDGDPAIFQFPARCAHRIENISPRLIYLLALYDRPEPGAVPFQGFLAGDRE